MPDPQVAFNAKEIDALPVPLKDSRTTKSKFYGFAGAVVQGKPIPRGLGVIVGQIVAANRSVKSHGLEIDALIPLAIQATRSPRGSVYVAEFEPWTPAEAEVSEADLGELVLAAEGLYSLVPPVAGIG